MNASCIACHEIEELFKQESYPGNRRAYINGIHEILKKQDSKEMLRYMADYDFNHFSAEPQSERRFTYTAFL